jgi:hypothetical protein
MECGPDSCGGYCGPCPENMPVCKAFHCYEACKEEDVSFEIVFPVQVLKISSMKIGQGGHFGEALDVDGDPNTCAPVGDCGNGLDNQLSGLYSQLNMFFDINMELASSLSTGSLVQLFETVGEVTVNQPFSMRLHDGIAAAAYPECNTSEPGCAYLINSAVMTFPDCKTYEIADCTVNEDGVLHAGGVEVRGLMVFPLAFQDTGTLLSPYNFQIVAHATVDSGQVVALDNGIIAGAFRKQDILDLVDEIPTTIDSPISRGMLKNLYDMFVVPDIDTDDDGVLDAASLSYTFESVSGTAVDMEYVPKGYTP